MEHFALFAKDNLDQTDAPVLDTASDEGIRTPEEDDLKSLGLSNRSYNALVKNNISKISQLSSMNHDQLVGVEGLGEKSIEEIERLIAGYKGQ